MTASLLLVYPALAQVLLTMVLMLMMGRARLAALQRGEVRVADIALGQRAWPDRVQQLSNNVHNQFETPILFYVLCGIGTVLGGANLLTALLAWIYVGTRVLHSYVHITSNSIRQRFQVFAVGLGTLVALWLAIFLHAAFGI